MKSCGDPNALLSKESILVVTKAAVSKIAFLVFPLGFNLVRNQPTHVSQELFIAFLTQQTYKKNGNKKDLNYNDLSSFVQKEEKLEFLHQIVPKKITVKEFREILERGSDSSDSDVDSSESESVDTDETGSEEEEGAGEEEEEAEDDQEEDWIEMCLIFKSINYYIIVHKFVGISYLNKLSNAFSISPPNATHT